MTKTFRGIFAFLLSAACLASALFLLFPATASAEESGAESLRAFSGRKVVSAAGVAEAGAKKREINMRLGSAIAGVADVVILAGENSRYIEKGLKQRGFSGEIIKTRGINQTAKALPHILRPGDVVWFQNDIP